MDSPPRKPQFGPLKPEVAARLFVRWLREINQRLARFSTNGQERDRVTNHKTPKIEQNPQADDPPMLAVLRSYWMRKCIGREMPSRHDVVPSEIKGQLPNVLLVDVLEGAAIFAIASSVRACTRISQPRQPAA